MGATVPEADSSQIRKTAESANPGLVFTGPALLCYTARMNLIAALLFGIVAGMRVFTAEAVYFGLRGGGALRIVFPILALGEYFVDATSWIPARTTLPSLTLRVVSGAYMGWIAARIPGIILGIVGALIGTFGGYRLRIQAITAIGGIPAAIIEDALAIGIAFGVVALSHTP